MTTNKAARRSLGRELRKTFGLEFTLAHSIAKAAGRLSGEHSFNGVVLAFLSPKLSPKLRELESSGFYSGSLPNRACGNPECCGYAYYGFLQFGSVKVEVR